MRIRGLGTLAVAMALLGGPGDSLHATQVCIDCPLPKKTRIDDGKWHTDVRLGPGVTKADAEMIIRGVRRTGIVDKPVSDKFKDFPLFRLEDVYYIGDASDYFATPDPFLAPAEAKVRYFSLSVGERPGDTALEHVIAVRDGRIERVAVMSWVA